MTETQNTEWKESWRDEYFKWVCGYANAQGGKFFIGVDDNGVVLGISNAKELLEKLSNQVRQFLDILVDVNLLEENNKRISGCVVEPYPYPISYKGKYHYRRGIVNHELIYRHARMLLSGIHSSLCPKKIWIPDFSGMTKGNLNHDSL